jgi:TolB-like protein/Tfp pilus assembly protein PilF
MNLETAPLLKRTWRELRRRKVVRVAVSYALIAWIVLQVAGVVFPPLHVPDWVMTWLVLAVILGFPIALLMAWWFERTPKGLVQDNRVVAGQGIRWIFGIGVAVLTVAALAWWLVRFYGLSNSESTQTRMSANTNAAITENSIAVMPFTDMSAEGDQQYLSDGLAEQLLDRLARVDGLNVVSRTSAFALRDSGKDAKEIGAILGAAYLLEGSVRKADGKLRITAQLIKTSDGFHLWTDTYERDNKDVFAMQDQITAAIATELGKHIGGVEKASVSSNAGENTTQDAAALELYMQGRAAWRLRTPGKLKEAIGFFEQAIARDKKFARAYAGLSDSYIFLADYGSLSTEEALSKAEAAAIEAITLAPESGEAWASLGLLRMTAGQYRGAETSFKEAMDRDPRYEMAPLWLARAYGAMGQLRNQQAVLAKAVALNPLEPVVVINASEAASNVGNIVEAERILERLLAVSPRNDMALRVMAYTQYNQGRLDRALQYANQAYQAVPEGTSNISTLAFMLMQLDREQEREKLLKSANLNEMSDEFTQIARMRQGNFSLVPHYQKFIDECLKTQSYEPGSQDMFLPSAITLINNKEYEKAIKLLQIPLADDDKSANGAQTLELMSFYIIALKKDGRQADAKLWLERLNTLSKEWLEQGWGGVTRAYIEASVASANGNRDLAIDSLEKADAMGWLASLPWEHDPRYREFAGDARLQAMQNRQKIKLQSQRAAAATIKIDVLKQKVAGI